MFHRGAVQALASKGTQITPRLATLVRKEVIRPDQPQLRGEDGFRFRHLLIRDTAYQGLPKSVRADLHVRLARWLQSRGERLAELDEIVGFHLAQAYAHRAELGSAESSRALAEEAVERLATAGRRAADRRDLHAAAALFRRARAPATSVQVRRGYLLALAGEREAAVAAELESEAILSDLGNEYALGSREASEELGFEVNPTVLSPMDWDSDATGFIRSLKEQPLIPILDRADERS